MGIFNKTLTLLTLDISIIPAKIDVVNHIVDTNQPKGMFMSEKVITKQVNIAMSECDLNRMIELMAFQRTQNRSAFVRSLIDKAWAEHQASQR